MKIEAGKLYAVITGDIVDSSKLPPKKRQQLHKVMKEGSNALRKAFKKDVPMNVDIFRGDSWQMLVSDPSKSLRLGLFYRAYIKFSYGIKQSGYPLGHWRGNYRFYSRHKSFGRRRRSLQKFRENAGGDFKICLHAFYFSRE